MTNMPCQQQPTGLQVARTESQGELLQGWDSLGGGERGGELGGGGERGGGLGDGSAHIHHIPKSEDCTYNVACISSMSDISCQQAACRPYALMTASSKDKTTTGGATRLRLTWWGWGRGWARWRGRKRRRTRWWICTYSSHTKKRRL